VEGLEERKGTEVVIRVGMGGFVYMVGLSEIGL